MNDYVGKHEPKTDYKKIPVWKLESARSGGCFHGEVWICCPYCGESIQIIGNTKEYLGTREGYDIYRCGSCGKLYKG